jgi:hypothetical protein
MLHTTTPSDSKEPSNTLAAEGEFLVAGRELLREKDTVISALNKLIDAKNDELVSIKLLTKHLLDTQQQLSAAQQREFQMELAEARMLALQYQGTLHMRGMLGGLTGL